MIGDPDNRVVTAYRRSEDDVRRERYFARRAVYRASDILEFETFPELKVSLSVVFRE
jgi:hypothetical protein